MNINEVSQLLKFVSGYTRVDANSVKPWYLALDTRITLDEAITITATAAASGERINPGTINTRYLEHIRPPAQQGIGRPHLPVTMRPPAREPRRALGAAEPVAPASVPEYVQARSAANQRAETARREWAVPCPYCHAHAGDPCTAGDGQRLTSRLSHPSRADAARLQPA